MFPTLRDSVTVVMFHTCFQHYYTLVLDSVIVMFQSAQNEDHGSLHHVAQGPPVHGGLHSHPAQPRAAQGPPVHGGLHRHPAQPKVHQSMADSIAIQPSPGQPKVRQSMADSIAIQPGPGWPIICPNSCAKRYVNSINGGDWACCKCLYTLPCGC